MNHCIRQPLSMLIGSVVAICLAIMLLLPSSVSAMDIEDGTYTVQYTVLQTNNDSVSIANDYFQKPATFIQVDGKQMIEFTVSYSAWVQSLQAQEGDSYKDVEVVAEDPEEDTRTVRFALHDDLSQPVYMQMHIKIETMEPIYDHQYTVRFAFDPTTLEWSGPAPEWPMDEQEPQNTTQGTMLLVYVLIALLIVISIFLFMKKTRKSKPNS